MIQVVKEAFQILFFPCYINKNYSRKRTLLLTSTAHYHLQTFSAPSSSPIFLQTHMLLNIPFTAIPSCILLSLDFLSQKNPPIRQMLNVAIIQPSFPFLVSGFWSLQSAFSSFSTFRVDILRDGGQSNTTTMSYCIDDRDIQFFKLPPSHYIIFPSPSTVAHFYSINKCFHFFSCFTN